MACRGRPLVSLLLGATTLEQRDGPGDRGRRGRAAFLAPSGLSAGGEADGAAPVSADQAVLCTGTAYMYR